MLKRLVFAVDIGQKMLGPFQQLQLRRQIDDFIGSSLYRRVFFRQQRQITHFVFMYHFAVSCPVNRQFNTMSFNLRFGT